MLFAQDTLVVVYSSNNLGTIYDCGCEKENYGGLARRKTVVDSLRKIHKNLLVADTGNFLVSYPGNFRDNDFILRAYSLIGYDFIGVQASEGNNGNDYFVQNIAEKFKVISANILHPSVNSLVIKNFQGFNVAFTGLYETPSPQDSINVLPHADEIRSLKNFSQKTKGNLKILLSYSGYDLEKKFDKDWLSLGFDLVIGGNSAKVSDKILISGNKTRFVECGYAGDFLGKVTIFKQGKNFEFRHELIELNSNIGENPEIKKLIDEYKNND
ncbi:hypothetical protein IT568_11475 [bacterium]|nr:hypothetical protein [bacterium]